MLDFLAASDHFENWDNFTDKCSVSLHAGAT
jgi:hypothetical protein